MSRLKAVAWTVDVPSHLALSSEQDVVRVVIRAISGKRRVLFEESRINLLMELWGKTRDEVSDRITEVQERAEDRERLLAADTSAKPADTKDEEDGDSKEKDSERARAYPTHATIRAMVQRVIYSDDSSEDDVSEILSESLDYDSETWLCLECLTRNRLIPEVELERGNE